MVGKKVGRYSNNTFSCLFPGYTSLLNLPSPSSTGAAPLSWSFLLTLCACCTLGHLHRLQFPSGVSACSMSCSVDNCSTMDCFLFLLSLRFLFLVFPMQFLTPCVVFSFPAAFSALEYILMEAPSSWPAGPAVRCAGAVGAAGAERVWQGTTPGVPWLGPRQSWPLVPRHWRWNQLHSFFCLWVATWMFWLTAIPSSFGLGRQSPPENLAGLKQAVSCCR